METYEVVQEYITPCGGEQYAVRTIYEVETEDPESYIRQTGQFPIVSVEQKDHSLLITTANEVGYKMRYTFSL